MHLRECNEKSWFWLLMLMAGSGMFGSWMRNW
jgi:hypothetical protein